MGAESPSANTILGMDGCLIPIRRYSNEPKAKHSSVSLCMLLCLPVFLCLSVSLCLCVPVYLSVSVSLSLCLRLQVRRCLSVSKCVCSCVNVYASVPLSLSMSVSVSLCVLLSLCLRLCSSWVFPDGHQQHRGKQLAKKLEFAGTTCHACRSYLWCLYSAIEPEGHQGIARRISQKNANRLRKLIRKHKTNLDARTVWKICCTMLWWLLVSMAE